MATRSEIRVSATPDENTAVEIADDEHLETAKLHEESIPAKIVKNDKYLYFCFCLSLITAASAILCAVVNIISASRSFSSGQNIFLGILRCYGVVIALFVAVAETEWEPIFRMWNVLEYWVGRGMLQCFVAVLTEAMAESSGGSSFESAFHVVVSYMLLGCGAFYSIAGLLCMGNLKRSRKQRAHMRDQAAKDLEDLERKRKELQSLLSAQS